jgi:hypothetical protein
MKLFAVLFAFMFIVGTVLQGKNSHDITEILLKVAINTINQTKPSLRNKYLVSHVYDTDSGYAKYQKPVKKAPS